MEAGSRSKRRKSAPPADESEPTFVNRVYATTVSHASVPAVVRIVSVPAATLESINLGKGELRAGALVTAAGSDASYAETPIWPDQFPGLAPGLSGVRDLVAMQLHLALGTQDVVLADENEINSVLAQGRELYARSDAPIRDLVDHVVHTPIVPVEESWPIFEPLAELISAAGGIESIPTLVLTSFGTAFGAVSGTAFGKILIKAVNKGAESAVSKVVDLFGDVILDETGKSQDELLHEKINWINSSLPESARAVATEKVVEAWARGELRR
jgi:hypothetical protein